jgi:hypothetical protein
LEYLYACGQYVEFNPVKAEIVKVKEDWEFSSARHYLGGMKNLLLDGYELPKVKIIIDANNSKEFEKGDGIGTELFKFKLRKDIK